MDLEKINRIMQIEIKISEEYIKLYQSEKTRDFNQDNKMSIIDNLKLLLSSESDFFHSLNYEEIISFQKYLKCNSKNIIAHYGLKQFQENTIERILIQLEDLKAKILTDWESTFSATSEKKIIKEIVGQEFFDIVVYLYDEYINKESCLEVQEALLRMKFVVIYFSFRHGKELDLLENNCKSKKISFLNSSMRILMQKNTNESNINIMEYTEEFKNKMALSYISMSFEDIKDILSNKMANASLATNYKSEIIVYLIYFRAAFLLLDENSFEKLYNAFDQMKEIAQIEEYFDIKISKEILEDRQRFPRLLVKMENGK